MLTIQYASDKKPGAKHNEDLFGFKGDTFWLLDGATSTDGPPLARDAYWLVHELDTALNALVSRDLDVSVLAAAACSLVGGQWSDTSELRPVAAMAVWRLRDGKLEAAVTGNVSLLVPSSTGVLELTDTRIVPAYRGANDMLLQALANGLEFESIEFQQLRKAMKMQEAQALAVSSTGWLASAAHREPGDFCRFTVTDLAPRSMLAASDGFMELRRFWGCADNAELLQSIDANPGGLREALVQLRLFERLPDSGRQFPRTKRHDDATAVLIGL